jgi:hypothetical protein
MLPLDLAPQRLLLIPERRDVPARRDPAGAARVRRYRLARVQLNARTPAARTARLAQLRRRYD